jgi:hypothetical protein
MPRRAKKEKVVKFMVELSNTASTTKFETKVILNLCIWMLRGSLYR